MFGESGDAKVRAEMRDEGSEVIRRLWSGEEVRYRGTRCTVWIGGERRHAFPSALQLDEATWARARGCALWKALLPGAEHPAEKAFQVAQSRGVIEDALADHSS